MNKIILKIFLVLCIFISNAVALIEVDITRGNLNPLPLAVSPLFVDKVSAQKISNELDGLKLGLEISNIIENNLKKTVYLIL